MTFEAVFKNALNFFPVQQAFIGWLNNRTSENFLQSLKGPRTGGGSAMDPDGNGAQARVPVRFAEALPGGGFEAQH